MPLLKQTRDNVAANEPCASGYRTFEGCSFLNPSDTQGIRHVASVSIFRAICSISSSNPLSRRIGFKPTANEMIAGDFEIISASSLRGFSIGAIFAPVIKETFCAKSRTLCVSVTWL